MVLGGFGPPVVASSVGRHLAFNNPFDQVIRGACDSDYLDAVDGAHGGYSGQHRPVAPGCVALNSASYRHYRRFFDKIVAASIKARMHYGSDEPRIET